MKYFRRTMTARLSLFAVFALVVASVGLPASAGASNSPEGASPLSANVSCAAGVVCMWESPNFSGTPDPRTCATGLEDIYAQSVINGCTNREVTLLGGSPSKWTVLGCMNPGGERPNPGLVTGINIGAPGTRC
jgi:hypothetical protein